MDQKALRSPACFRTAFAVWRDLMRESTGKRLPEIGLNWDGRVSLLRLGYATYQLSLGSHSRTEALFHWADVKRVER